MMASTHTEPSRPTIGALYTPGDGDVAECKAIGPTHVVVGWVKVKSKRHVIITREEFAASFVAVPSEQHHQLELGLNG